MKRNKNYNPRRFSLGVHILWFLGVAVVLLLLPASFTAPARTLFLQSSGPALDFNYSVIGNTAAATGSLREALLNKEASRIAAQQLHTLKNQNERLKEELHTLRSRIRDYQALDVPSDPFIALSADVVAYDTSPNRKSLSLAAGSHHGIKGGEIVVAGGAAVGIVAEPGRYYSRVRLLTDPETTLPVRSQKSRILYVLRGMDGLRCRIDMADKNHDLHEGDLLITALITGTKDHIPLIPPGIPVAEVTSVTHDKILPLFHKVEARPLAHLNRIERVLIIRRENYQ